VTNTWTPRDTTTHQDHVIAHVIDATVRGYFVFDEALYILLDIGFVWTIFLDGEMSLLPHPVAVGELEVEAAAREQIKADIDILLSDNPSLDELAQLKPAPVHCRITAVSFFASGEERRLVLAGEGASLAIETSMTTAEIQIYEC
jgi:hypothetical protein